MSARSLLSALSGGLEGWSVAFYGADAEQLLASVSAQRRHVWCAIWAQFSLRADRIEQPDAIDQWRDDLRNRSSRELLKRAGFGRATGFRTALGKLGWAALSKANGYLELADTLELGGQRSKLLRHLETIDLRVIQLTSHMPYDGCSPRTLARFLASKLVTPTMLDRLAWRGDRCSAKGVVTARHRLLDFASEALIERGDLNTGLPFPDPPWIGTNKLRPLDTPAKLGSAALRFANCLANQMRYVWLGSAYFYELEELAILELERVADLGWEIVQVRGPGNEPVSWTAVVALEHELARAPGYISRIKPRYGECFL